ncbi:MAG: hypothetical protein WCV99_19765 [Sterolibacterium sp.]
MKHPISALLVAMVLSINSLALAAVSCSGSLILKTPSGTESPRSEPLAANQTMQLTTSGLSCTGGSPEYAWTTLGFLGSAAGPSGNVVSVSQGGLVTGLVEGYAFVRATEANSGAWAEATFSVTAAAVGTTAAQPAEFSLVTGLLTVPEISISGQIYRNAHFQWTGDLNFSLVDIEQPTANGICSESNISFIRYTSLPTWYTVVTESSLNELIGCTGTLASQGTAGTIRWSLPSSTEACPRYIEVELGKDSTGNWKNYGQSIRGINSETNQPYAC